MDNRKICPIIYIICVMLSKKTSTSLNAVFISTVHRDGYPVPPIIVPITFLVSPEGSDLMDVMKYHPFPPTDPFRLDFRKKLSDDLSQLIPDCQFDLCFLRRNYDGSETYYLVSDLTLEELGKLEKFIKNQKGGVLK